MKKPTLAVIFGSRSAEHDVSIITAIAAVIKPLELTKKYEVVPIYIAKDGKWYCDNKLKDIKLYTSGKIEEFLSKNKPVSIQFNNGLIIQKPGLKTTNIRIDIAFPATHGTHGEDGELMAVLEMANIPYVGCDVPSSVVSMDKVLSKIVAANAGVITNIYQWFYSYEYVQKPDEILKKLAQLKMPLFVKPDHLGSSIGMTKVTSEGELKNAIEVAAFYDDKIIVEEAVNNLIEVTVPVMGNREPIAAMVEKPLLKDEDFFDFESKYIMQGGKKGGGKGDKKGGQGYSQIPAELPGKLYQTSIDTAIEVYQALGCSGIARVDLLIDSKAEIVYFNEINPLPGDLYVHNWRAAGVSNVGLVTKLVDLALERHQEKQKLATVFTTNYLKQF